MSVYEFKKSYEMFDEVQKYIPGGISFPRTPRFLTFGSFPVFTARTQGAKFWDVDGNEFIDYMCSYGAVLLGYNHPAVDEAYRRQLEKCNSTTVPSNLWLDCAKFLVGEIPYMDWAVFGKNGSDVTSYSAMVARHYTGRNGIVMAHNAYHGLHHWCIESTAGIPPEYKMHVYKFEYNDLDSLKEVVEQNKGKIAGVMLTPVGHWALKDQEEPAKGFYEGVRKLCDEEGILMIIDDIRCGFRLKYEGSHRYYTGVDPDLICFGKAIGNGYPISVAMGTNRLLDSAKAIYWSGTHFYSAAPMAALMACLKEIKESGAIEKIFDMGTRFMNGLREQAKLHELEVSVTGHPAMPYMTFANDESREKNRFFCGEAAKRGIFLHPHHNWFVSAALTEEELEKTLDVTNECFKLTAQKVG